MVAVIAVPLKDVGQYLFGMAVKDGTLWSATIVTA